MQRSRPALLTLVTLFPILANPHPPDPQYPPKWEESDNSQSSLRGGHGHIRDQ